MLTSRKRGLILLSLSLTGILLGGCAYVAVATAPAKEASAVRLASAVAADAAFWPAFQAGQYDRIPDLLNIITAAYLANPDDAVTAAHIGWLHIWRLSERWREPSLTASITDDIVLARKYFATAVQLDPGDARYLGFLAASTMAEGDVDHDEATIRRGYFMMHRAVTAWPEFNLFTAGYVMSASPVTSPQFTEALEDEWRDLDACAGETVDRTDPRVATYFARRPVTTGARRVCWNSAIAPHNIEGFFLNFGDMLVKSGDWQRGQAMYANAKLSPDYAAWAFRDVLEGRIAESEQNVAVFARGAPESERPAKPMMFDAAFSCMACHQR